MTHFTCREQDIPVDIANLCLPLSISMQLSTHFNFSIPPIHNAHEPVEGKMDTFTFLWLNLNEILHIGATKQFTFPLSDLDLDDLHFISPCTDATIKMLKRSGVPGATNRLCEQHAISKTLDNCNQYPLARLEVSIYQSVMFSSHLYCYLGPIF